jgi:hypothetical protein
MELKKVSSAKISYEDGACDKACAANCIYFWPDPAADLKDNLSNIRSRRGDPRLASRMSV